MRCILIQTESDFIWMESILGMRQNISVDTETNMLDTFCDDFQIVGLSLAADTQTGYYIPLGHRIPPDKEDQPKPKQLSISWVMPRLNTFLKGRRVSGANHKFDTHVFDRYGVCIGTTVFDTHLAAYVYDTRDCKIGLKDMVFLKLGYKATDIDTLCAEVKPKVKKNKNDRRNGLGMEFLSPEQALEYATADAVNVQRLKKWYEPRLQEENLVHINQLELDVAPIIGNMETCGVLVDANKLTEIHDKIKVEEDKCLAIIKQIANQEDLNLRSGPQMGDLIYHQMGLRHPKGKPLYAKGDKPPQGWLEKDTIAKILANVKESTDTVYGDYRIKQWTKQQVIDLLTNKRKYSKLSKLRSTYTINMLDLLGDDGRLHTDYKQLMETGRLSCIDGQTILETSCGKFCISDKNLTKYQNISIMTHRGRMRRILRQIYKGQEEMFDVKLSNGKTLTCTKDHKILTEEGWKKLADIGVGERLYSPPSEAARSSNTQTDSIVRTGLCRAVFESGTDLFTTQYTGSIFKSVQHDPTCLSGEISNRNNIEERRELYTSSVSSPTEKAERKARCTNPKRETGGDAASWHGHDFDGQRMQDNRVVYKREPEISRSLDQTCAQITTQTTKQQPPIAFDLVYTKSRHKNSCGGVRSRSGPAFSGPVRDLFSPVRNALVFSGQYKNSTRLQNIHQNITKEQYLLESKQGRSQTIPLVNDCWYTAHTPIYGRTSVHVRLLNSRNQPTYRGGWVFSSETARDGFFRSEERRSHKGSGIHNPKDTRYRTKKESGGSGTNYTKCYVESIKPAGVRGVWDIEVEEDHSYVACGIINHNSSSPNLQNLPRGDDKDTKEFDIRAAFIADPGYVFVKADYAAQELRIIAALSGDPAMRDIFTGAKRDEEGNELDPHIYVAALAFETPYMEIYKAVQKKKKGEELTDRDKELIQYRQDSKPTNFGIAYGQTEAGLAEKIDKSLEFATFLMNSWKQKIFPVAAAWMDNTVEYAKANLYVLTALGRKRRMSTAALYLNKYEFAHIANQMRNAPVQGTAADMTKQAMIRLDRALKPYGNDARISGQIHDELIILCKEELAEEIKTLAEKEMADNINGIPFPVEAVISKTMSKE